MRSYHHHCHLGNRASFRLQDTRASFRVPSSSFLCLNFCSDLSSTSTAQAAPTPHTFNTKQTASCATWFRTRQPYEFPTDQAEFARCEGRSAEEGDRERDGEGETLGGDQEFDALDEFGKWWDWKR